ncbi:TonB-dependent receptor [Chitinophaga tropicalis]|uniref:TonB-dependent receptor plug domain-containing protein n=1 Tax=Chitinophaga tropicalis TaxID=2683588 RepID=A0A7K1UCJ2_9BACT|nr:TonB-dependent receptor [Chitinophaga tropicalis]MVT12099.1 TonB-dependent receptor plug domain-containing protein [Chitinophaga tropicalis]
MKKLLPPLFFTILLTNAVLAQKLITGVVRGEKGSPVPGATVSLKGSTNHAVADNKGEFSIRTYAPFPLTLAVTSIGFATREVQVTEENQNSLEVILIVDNRQLNEISVTARRRNEKIQSVPIAISVVRGNVVEDAGAFNVNRVKELIPTVQLYSSNPRNTTLNIRGLGSTFGLTNDGIDPGVGFYLDGVYYARPAATTLDFVDVEQIEVLRGPQGTLFGKNTTAGALNITTRKPSFSPGATAEVSYGNYGYIQAKASVTGAIASKLAGRVSFSGTQRDGTIYNVSSLKHVNDINNIGGRAQLLYTPSERVSITLIGDATQQRPEGYAQVVAGVVKTQRPAYRQFDNIIADLHYQLPSRNPFDRLIDHNTTWRSGNDLGGVSLNVDAKIGGGTLTSTTAWRYWHWDPSNDRDFTGLPVLTLSQATSRHQQWSQEVRYAGNFSSKLSGVIGIFVIGQNLKTDPYHVEESGSAQWRFSQNSTSELWKTPGLLEGYGIRTTSRLKTLSAAIFGQLDWAITERLHVLPGLRYNYDDKEVDFNRKTYGGLETTDPALLALKNVVYTDQVFNANTDNTNLSGQLTVSFKASDRVNTYATYSTNYKPVGLNLGGLPTSNGQPMLELAEIKPEYVQHFEVGIKTTPSASSVLNLAIYNTDIKDFQTQVQTAELGVNRGYLANAEKVRVRGAELDGNIRFDDHFSLFGAIAYTDGKYKSFKNAPVPLEETGGPSAFKDISGGRLPGISKWTASLGGEASTGGKFLGQGGRYFVALDGYYRSEFSSSPSPSPYLNVDGYVLLNGRFGFRAAKGVSLFIWGRNLLNKNYFEQLLVAAGNAGHYAAVLGDPRTYGVTLRYVFNPSN